MEGAGPLSRAGHQESTVIDLFNKTSRKECVNTIFSLFYIHSFDASEDDIRRAYRKIVLKHHPDKRKAQGEEIKSDDDYFTCITRAYETLSEFGPSPSYVFRY